MRSKRTRHLSPVFCAVAVLFLAVSPVAAQRATDHKQLKYPSLRDVAVPEVQRVTLSGLGGVRFRAYLCTPQVGAGAGPRPAVVCTPGYGGGTPHTSWWGLCYDRGFALLVVYPRGQGDSAELWTVPAGLSKLTMGLDDPAGHYYRAAYADCLRGIDFLCEHPGIDRERIGALGLSQGGGLTLATAALDGRVRAAVAHEPFLCNYPVAIETATTGP